MVYLKKLKNFSIVFGLGSLIFFLFLFYKIGFLETENCRSGDLESPIFDFSTTSTFNKFLWFGTKEGGQIDFEFCVDNDSDIDYSNCVLISSEPGEIVYLKNLNLENLKGRYMKYKIRMESCDESAIPRVDRIFLYYNK
jgi:hypothetical protein